MKIVLDSTMAEILPVFLAEAVEGIELMEAAVLRLEHDPSDHESINEIFRIVHTIKGDSASLGFKKLAEFSHALENGLDHLRKVSVADATIVQILFESIDEFRKALGAADSQQDRLTRAQQKLKQRVNRWMNIATPARDSEDDDATSTTRASDSRLETTSGYNASRYIRVDVEKLDQLLTLVGEVAVARGGLTEKLEADASRAALLANHRAADRLHLELQELVMRVRMVPVGPAFRRHQRLIRDVATRLGKQVTLELSGGDVELDSSVLQLLQDPLSHMVRNAVHHGLETPRERIESGKPPLGRIALRTRQEGGSIVIELFDDGRGIDREGVKRRAVEMGLLDKDAEPGERELLELIFEPGFSTTTEVTDLAGRGVGLDVVRQNLETLRSSIEVESEVGLYTLIRIHVPLTLAIVDGLIVQCGEEEYIAPTESIVELVDLNGSDCSEHNGLLNLRGEALDALRLRDVLQPTSRITSLLNETVIVVRNGASRLGLIVDGIRGKAQVVIKPLPRTLSMVPALAGTSVLGSGRVAFLLDIHHLARKKKSQTSQHPI